MPEVKDSDDASSDNITAVDHAPRFVIISSIQYISTQPDTTKIELIHGIHTLVSTGNKY